MPDEKISLPAIQWLPATQPLQQGLTIGATLLVQTGTFVPEKSNIWRDCVDGMYDWVKEHIEEVGQQRGTRRVHDVVPDAEVAPYADRLS